MKIAQDQHYKGDDWWDWKVWLAASPAELDQVKSVIWHLHPSFEPQDVQVDERKSQFALNTSGWGTFRVRVTVMYKSGSTQRLSHELELSYPDGSSTQT